MRFLNAIAQDLRFALRQLRRAPGYAATAILILAIGIGATTGVYSIVRHVLLAPLPFPNGHRLVTLLSTVGRGEFFLPPGQPLLEAWAKQARTIEHALIYEPVAPRYGDSTRGPATNLVGAAVPPELFTLLGVRPMLGRPILASDTLPDAPPVVLLGATTWRTTFGGADLLGKTIALDGVMHTVIGVLPDGFTPPFAFRDVGAMVVATRHGVPLRRATAIGVLRSGASIADANREAARLFPPKSQWNATQEPPRIMRQVDFVKQSKQHLLMTLLGAVALVLFIACANVANLSLARAWSRQREIAVRTALGASRWRVAQQVLTESLLLSLVAGALGIGLSFLVLKGIRAVVPNGATEYGDVHVNMAVLAWAVGLSVLTGVVFGLAPVLGTMRTHPGEALKAGARSTTGGAGGRRLRSTLVIAEVALSVVLFTGAGLLVRTLGALRRVDVGFQSRGLVIGRVPLSARGLADKATRSAALTAALGGVRAIPGVRDALFVMAGPPELEPYIDGVTVDGRPDALRDTLQVITGGMGPAELFAFAGMTFHQGRTFRPTVGLVENTDEVIINASLARHLWPNGDALGARIKAGHEAFFRTVVGVVGDVRLPGKETTVRGNREFQFYLPQSAAPAFSTSLLVRSDLPVAQLTPAIALALRSAHPDLTFENAKTAQAVIEQSFASQRFALDLLGAFALVAMVLAAIGLHAVIAYDVAQRTREIGVRIALGAQASDVTGFVLGRSLAVALVGVVVGVGAALAATRALRSLLYGVEPGDPATLVVVGLGLMGIALVATYAPAHRAARLDPVSALRAE